MTKTDQHSQSARMRWQSLGLDLVTLQILMAAAEEQSFAAAATRANISLSAVSRRIADFEARVGVALFARHDRGVSLTPAGEQLVLQLRDLFDLLEGIALDLEATRGGKRGVIRLETHMSATVGPLPEKLASFRQLYPDIHVQVSEQTSVEVAHAVSIGMADLGLVSGTLPIDNLQLINWHEDELVVVLPLDHPLLEKDRIRFADIVGEPFIGLQKDSALLSLYRQHMEVLGHRLDERAHTSSFESVCRLVSAGLGIAIVPALAAHGNGISTRPLDESWARRPLMLCMRDPEKLSAAAKLLVAHLLEA
jgi:DNA-binding transcriptional LysR family regulator